MKAKQLISALKIALQNKLNVLVKGSPGIGKSDIINATAAELKFDTLICHPVVEEPTDAKGLPAIVGDKAEFLPYGNLRRMIEAKKPLVVFLDDLGQASGAVQAAYMQLLLAREVDGKKISDHVRFVAATNSRKDGAGVNGLLTPLLSRFALITELECGADEWTQWALKNDVPVELIAFIHFRPQMLSTFKVTREIENFACPRTVTMLGKWIKLGCNELSVWTGCVGEAMAVEFAAFWKTYNELAGLPEKCILSPDSAPIPTDPAVKYALTGALAHKATEKNLDAIFKYGERLSPEFNTVLVKDTIGRNAKLTSSEAFVRWSVKNPNVIQ